MRRAPPKRQLRRSLFVGAILAATIAVAVWTVDRYFWDISDALCDWSATQEGGEGTASYEEEMYWGSYRPNVLVGVKSRSKAPMLVGVRVTDTVMGISRYDTVDSDDVVFGWQWNDGRYAGTHSVSDRQMGFKMQTSLLKYNGGKSWTLVGTLTRDVPQNHPGGPLHITVFVAQVSSLNGGNISATELDHKVTLRTMLAEDSPWGESPVNINMETYSPPWNNQAHWLPMAQWRVPSNQVWDTSRLQSQRLSRTGNVVALTFPTQRRTSRFVVSLFPRGDSPLSMCDVLRRLAQRRAAFERRFASLFPGATPREMAVAAMANVLGGLGHWHGHGHAVDDASDARDDGAGVIGAPSATTRGPAATLFATVPSRSKFPRGFVWDEGFHQLLVSRWDADIARDVLLHWFRMVTNGTERHGWLPREQILGLESEARVPREFIAQHPTHANPPALILSMMPMIDACLDGSEQCGDGERKFLLEVATPVRWWLEWFLRTQCGAEAPCPRQPEETLQQWIERVAAMGFRWRSRNGFHLLASGLDDYPRPTCKGMHRRARHVDLFVWVALLTRCVSKLQKFVDPSDAIDYDAVPWTTLLREMHYNATLRGFADVTGCKAEALRHSPFIGYVNLFPLLTMMINDRGEAERIIQQAMQHLFVRGLGLRSVSNDSMKHFAWWKIQHESYWVGPLWINIHYLFLRALALRYNAMVGDVAQDAYDQVRGAIVKTVTEEYFRTGKLWEHYEPIHGQGRGTAPFTGWTALILLILSEQYH